jgi:hypothetical protein
LEVEVEVTEMKSRILVLTVAAAITSTAVQAATLQVTYINNTPLAGSYPDATRITFRFANNIDNATVFNFSSFYDRIWYRPELLPQGVTNVLNLLGPYPAANFVGTTFSSSYLRYDQNGEIQYGVFDLRDYQPTPGFYPASWEYYTNSKNLTLRALWDAVPNGSVFRFTRESYVYDPTGTAADFAVAVSEAPVPASVWMFGSVVAGIGAFKRLRRKKLSQRT